jgi:hypothetical protein
MMKEQGMMKTEPRILRTHRLIMNGSSRDSVGCTDDDILAAIEDCARHASTRYVMISAVAVALGLGADDRAWLLQRIHVMDEAGSVMLSPVEKPQILALYQACWQVRNASGLPCHEITVAERSVEVCNAPALPMQTHPGPPWPRADDKSSRNPTVQQQRISALVKSAAEQLQQLGMRRSA